MNESWFRQLSVQALATPPWPDPRFPPAPYYRFLRLLAQAVQPSLSVELGVAGGGGSFHLALGWPAGTVVGVENAEGSSFELGNWACVKRTCPNFVLWKGDSARSAPGVARRYGKADILFVDTAHQADRAWKEFQAWEPHLSDEAVACFDDLLHPGMDGLWERIPWWKVRLDELHGGAEVGGGFGAVWR